jgi:hypothetical protein
MGMDIFQAPEFVTLEASEAMIGRMKAETAFGADGKPHYAGRCFNEKNVCHCPLHCRGQRASPVVGQIVADCQCKPRQRDPQAGLEEESRKISSHIGAASLVEWAHGCATQPISRSHTVNRINNTLYNC